MSSIVFYKFIHQKNRLVVHFDGTAISVFDLKREIISENQLGTGYDFTLTLFHSELPETEYELDQDSVPRSSFVLAKRSPANPRSRFGNASRYVTGKPRINRKFPHNSTASAAQQPFAQTATSLRLLDDVISEEDRIKLMFENQSNAWAQTQEELATHKAIYNKPTARPVGVQLANDLPPPGYICYRCGKKDHWIKNCPTNNDPSFEGKKIMRTTGIPKLYLKTIAKEDVENLMEEHGLSTNEHGDIVDKDGNAVLITGEGDYAIAMADSKTWISYQEKQQNAALKAKQDFENRMVECAENEQQWQFLNPLRSKKLLCAPIVMTPCCQEQAKLQKMRNFNYNQNELEQVLIENDFYCPNCGREDVYLDSLVPNTELESTLQAFIQEKSSQLGITDPNARHKRLTSDSAGTDSGGNTGEGESVKRQRLDTQQPIGPMHVPPPSFGGMMPMPPMGPFPPGSLPMMPMPPNFGPFIPPKGNP